MIELDRITLSTILLSRSISGIGQIVGAFLRREVIEEVPIRRHVPSMVRSSALRSRALSLAKPARSD